VVDKNNSMKIEAVSPAYERLAQKSFPKVSVVVPSYNHEKYIGETLESVIHQTYQDYEIVINDDASRDNSVETIKTFVASHPEIPIKFLSQAENQGGVLTLNHLVENSNGEYIALLNSDDTWLPEKLKRQVAFLDQHPEIGAVFTQAMIVDDSGVELTMHEDFLVDIFMQKNRSRGMWLRRLFFELNCLCHPSILIRRSVYEKNGLYDPRYRQLPDMQMWVRLFKYTTIHIIETPLVNLRFHTSNTSSLNIDNKIRNVNELNMILANFFEGVPDDVMIEGFSDLFKKKDASTPAEIACEKAFLYFIPEYSFKSLYSHLGLARLYELLGQPETRDALRQSYQFDYSSFFRLSGTSFFEGNLVSIINNMEDATSGTQGPRTFFRNMYLTDRHYFAVYMSRRYPELHRKILKVWLFLKRKSA
jgi:glycosyltransferase involved in cell wall biosynthesis